MGKVIHVLAIILAGIVLGQLLDFSFYLMNQSDTFVFNIGLVVFGTVFVAFGFLGLYLLKVLKPEKEEKEEVKQEKEKEL